MKYLKPESAILVGSSTSSTHGVDIRGEYTATATLSLTTVCSDGSGEQLQGIYVTRSQLEQIRNEIDNYLQKTAESQSKLGIADSKQKPEADAITTEVNASTEIDGSETHLAWKLRNWSKVFGEAEAAKSGTSNATLNPSNFGKVDDTPALGSNDAEQKQKLKINSKLVWMEQSDEIPSKPYCAKISEWCNPGDGDRGSISLYALGSSEEEARATLDAQFEALVLRCVDTKLTKLEVLDTTFNYQLNELRQKIREDLFSNPKIRAIMKALTGIDPLEEAEQNSDATPNPKNSKKSDDMPASENKNTEQKQKWKINPELVKIEQSVDEASSGLYRASIDDWRNLTDNRAGYIYLYGLGFSEEEARAKLNAQFEALVLRFVDIETTGLEISTATSADNLEKVDDTPASENEETEQKQKLKIKPKLVWIEQSNEIPSKPYSAKTSEWCSSDDGGKGDISLYALGNSEEEARAILDEQFEALVLRCADMEETKLRTSNAMPNPDNSEEVDDTPASKVEKTELSKTEGKNQTFKLNPNRVASRIDRNVTGYAQWEARTTLYFGNTPLEVVCSKHWTEQSARKALDYKVKRLIDRLTD
jgi:hypothetical protein